MKKFILKGLVFSLLALGFASCGDSDDETWVEPEFINGAYILNSGKFSGNNSNLGFYDFETGKYTAKVFYNQNDGMSIGDTGNDMVVYGSKMYILATGSSKIYVTDLKGKLLKYSNRTPAVLDTKNDAGEAEGPRHGVAHNGKVYVSLKAGYVARVDTTSMLIDGKVKVGSYPEGMIVANNNLYVANSGGGNENTMSIVDLGQFEETRKKTVALNPISLASDNSGNIYIASWGKSWEGISSQLQKYNPTSDELTVLGTDVATKMVMSKDKDKLFIIKETYIENKSTSTLLYYDVKKDKLINESFVKTDASVDLSKAYSISVNPNNGDIYIGTSDYNTDGDMHIFSADGTYKQSFDTKGLNPMGAYFVSHTY